MMCNKLLGNTNVSNELESQNLMLDIYSKKEENMQSTDTAHKLTSISYVLCILAPTHISSEKI